MSDIFQSSSSQTSPEPIPARWLIVCQREIEASYLKKLLKNHREIYTPQFNLTTGTLHQTAITLCVVGHHLPTLASTTETLLATYPTERLLVIGFLTGLQAGLQVGDLFCANELINPALESQPQLNRLQVAPLSFLPAKTHQGRLVSLLSLPVNIREKETAQQQNQAAAADKISFTVAGIARNNKVPFGTLHILESAFDQEPVKEVRHFEQQTSLAGQVGVLLSNLWNRPKSVKEIWNQQESRL